MLMLEGLRVGNLDMAVVYDAAYSPDVEISMLHTEALVLISKTTAAKQQKAKRQPIELKEVADLPLILPSRPNAFRMLVDSEMNAIGRKPQITLEVDGLNAILSLVKEGLGHAVLPSYTLSNFDDPSPFTLRSITQPCIMSQLMLVRAARRSSTETQKIAADVVKSVVMLAM